MTDQHVSSVHAPAGEEDVKEDSHAEPEVMAEKEHTRPGEPVSKPTLEIESEEQPHDASAGSQLPEELPEPIEKDQQPQGAESDGYYPQNLDVCGDTALFFFGF